MSVAPADVARVTPPRGSDHDLATNRHHVADGAAGKLTAADLVVTASGRRGVWMGYTLIVGEPARHGTVADEAAMLALHDWADDPHTRTLYHYVQAGDSVLREDDPGYYWVCLAGHGTALSQWERRPLGDTVADAIALLATKIGSSSLEGYQPLLANRATLAKIGEAAGTPMWNGAPWPGGGGGGTGGISCKTTLARNADQSAVSGAAVWVEFDTASENGAGVWSAGAPSRLTVPVGQGGIWQFSIWYWGNSNYSGLVQVGARKNGSVFVMGDEIPGLSGQAFQRSLTFDLALADGDYVELYVYHTTGTTRTFRANTFNCYRLG